ncbi:MAG: hypothetical protein BMS9Abin30_1025 [Gammaproteobacteria bacterium]|nr:MAG: hypothetical protein BMS9Abin30_1025 [Gammaproteobacteria bacterium]
MKARKVSLIISSLLVAALATSPVWAKKDLPAINEEGMELVKDTKMTTIYADPGADLGIYNRIMLEDASVAFKKNWQRDQNRSQRGVSRVKDSDMERIRQDVATLFREVFTAELVDGGYELTDQAGEDVLIAKPAIVDLDVIAPDIMTASRTYSYSESAGEMTLVLELYDSRTNDKIVTARDRKRDYRKGYLQWRTSVSNRSTAKRLMSSWAIAFREALDDARATVTASD